jgi:hypothetical protein
MENIMYKQLLSLVKSLSQLIVCITMTMVSLWAMDADELCYRSLPKNGAQYHDGMRRMTTRVNNSIVNEIGLDQFNMIRYKPDVTSMMNARDQGKIVCACCNDFVLFTCSRYFYEYCWHAKMSSMCISPYDESVSYRWRWICTQTVAAPSCAELQERQALLEEQQDKKNEEKEKGKGNKKQKHNQRKNLNFLSWRGLNTYTTYRC